MVVKLRDINDDSERVFAIGDIHGCRNELNTLLTHLYESENLTQRDLVIFIGDYVDRGPDSRGVIDRLIDFQQEFPKSVFLRGNHEDMLLDHLGFGGRMGQAYLFNGGDATFKSYQIPLGDTPKAQLEQIPEEHIDFLVGLEGYVQVGSYVFAHAGLSPIRDLNAQEEQDIYWIRDEFIQNKHPFPKTVVFGHTPYENVFFEPPFKIGIDTGLVYGNLLSCVELASQTIHQVRSGENKVTVKSFPERYLRK